MYPLRYSAIVDREGPALGHKGEWWWKVTVREAFPGVEERVYRIRAASDNDAAQAGMRQFGEELAPKFMV